VGVGSVDGDAEISLMLNGEPYKPKRLHGRVLFTWRGDWYSQEAIVRYTPKSAKTGSIQLFYRFRAL
jgi:hypothetical protein